jgi:hypothetical protein
VAVAVAVPVSKSVFSFFLLVSFGVCTVWFGMVCFGAVLCGVV